MVTMFHKVCVLMRSDVDKYYSSKMDVMIFDGSDEIIIVCFNDKCAARV